MKIKQRIAYRLRALSADITDFCFHIDKFADRIDGREREEVDFDRMWESIHTSIVARRDNPCPRCGGEGAVPVSAGTDFVGCEACQGTGIALEADKST